MRFPDLKVTVFPNWAAKSAAGAIALEVSHRLLLDAPAARMGGIALAAPLHVHDAKGTFAPLENPAVRFLSLGNVDVRRGKAIRALGYARMFPRLLRVVRGADFCYVFAPGHIGLVCVLACWIAGKRYGLYLRGDWNETPIWARWMGPRIFRKAAFILCTGEQLAATIRRFNPWSEAVVPMSLLLYYYPSPPPRPTRPTGAPVEFLYVGELVREKGLFELVEAFRRLCKTRGIVARLTLIGEGVARGGLERVVFSAGLDEYVSFSGLVADPHRLAAAFRRSDVFCLPTYAEGFPRVLYEAMGFSLAILASPVGQIPTILEDGRSALFVPPREVDTLEDAMAALASNPERRTALGSSARAALEPLARAWRSRGAHGDQLIAWLERASATPGEA